MAENPTDLIAEFQKLRHETSGISRNLMARTRSVDARRNSSSSSNNEVLKVMNENHDAICKKIEAAQKKQEEFSKKQEENLKAQLDAQNRMMKEVLEDLRFVRMEIADIKKQQKEDSETLENITTQNSQIEQSLVNPTIGELCGLWQAHCNYPYTWLSARQMFSIEANTLTWSHSRKKSYIDVADVKIGSNRCKVNEDGIVEIETDRGDKYKLEVQGNTLSITYGESCTTYRKC